VLLDHQPASSGVTANKPAQGGAAQCLKAAGNLGRVQHLPGQHRLGDALNLDCPKIAIFEEITDQPARCDTADLKEAKALLDELE